MFLLYSLLHVVYQACSQSHRTARPSHTMDSMRTHVHAHVVSRHVHGISHTSRSASRSRTNNGQEEHINYLGHCPVLKCQTLSDQPTVPVRSTKAMGRESGVCFWDLSAVNQTRRSIHRRACTKHGAASGSTAAPCTRKRASDCAMVGRGCGTGRGGGDPRTSANGSRELGSHLRSRAAAGKWPGEQAVSTRLHGRPLPPCESGFRESTTGAWEERPRERPRQAVWHAP